MNAVPVVGTNLASVGYDPTSSTLEVEEQRVHLSRNPFGALGMMPMSPSTPHLAELPASFTARMETQPC